MKILAIDDDRLNLAMLDEILGEDYELITANNGEEGVVAANEQRPDGFERGTDRREACGVERKGGDRVVERVAPADGGADVGEQGGEVGDVVGEEGRAIADGRGPGRRCGRRAW